MLSWIGANLATILITLVLAKVVVGILVHMRKDKKKEKSSCDCGLCPMGGSCHKSLADKEDAGFIACVFFWRCESFEKG